MCYEVKFIPCHCMCESKVNQINKNGHLYYNDINIIQKQPCLMVTIEVVTDKQQKQQIEEI